jgi:hypothetical protein
LRRGSRIISGRPPLGEGGVNFKAQDGQDGKDQLSLAEPRAAVFGHFPGR